MGTVARDNVIGIFIPTRQGRRAVIEPEMAFRFFPTMTAQTRIFENGPDVAIKNNLYISGGRQRHEVGFCSREREAQSGKNRHQARRKTGEAPGNRTAI